MIQDLSHRFGLPARRSRVSRSSSPAAGPRERLGAVGLQRVLGVGSGERPVVRRSVVGHRARGHVDHPLAVPVDLQPVAVGDLADDGGVDVPLLADRQERVDVAGLDDRHHPFLALAHQDLLGSQRGVAQRDPVELDVHAAVARAGQLAGRAGQAGAAEVLDAGDQSRGEELEGALDEQLLHERVADLDARPLGRTGGVEGLAGEHADPADAVAAGLGAVQDDLVADAARLGEVQVLVAEHADAQGVDERVAEIGLVEDRLAADVRQAEAVAVAADAGDDPGQHPVGVGRVEGAEPQRVHHRDRAGAHREDVADDAADAGGRTLVGLDVRRVVVALDLEGDRVALADVDDAGVLADAGQHLADSRVSCGDLGELLEVHLGGLVGAVLAPHHRVHRQLRAGRPAAEDLADPGVLVALQAELGPGLLVLGIGGREGDGVEVGRGGLVRVSVLVSGTGSTYWDRVLQAYGPTAASRGTPNRRRAYILAISNYTFVIHSRPVTGVISGVRVIGISRHSWRFRCFPDSPGAPPPGCTASLAACLVGALVATLLGVLPSAPAYAANPVTPGNFTGLGFDQCDAPRASRAMSAWIKSSPFRAAGIYISGNSRACRTQTNLTPTWVRNQLAAGWHLMPITLGPQASCSTRYPRYGKNIDPTINPSSDEHLLRGPGPGPGRGQEGGQPPRSASASSAGSTIFYDLEAFDTRRSTAVHDLGAVVPARLDQPAARAQATPPASTPAPRRASGCSTTPGSAPNNPIHAARPDLDRGLERPGQHQLVLHPQRRVAALQPDEAVPGGHNETWGGVTINIDRNYLNLRTPKIPGAEHSGTGPGTGRPEVHRQLDRGPPVHARVDQPARATARPIARTQHRA